MDQARFNVMTRMLHRIPCRRDADCVALGVPPGVACAPRSKGLCAGICETGMACILPCGAEPPQPPDASSSPSWRYAPSNG
jgi:hypothetical protein